MSRLIEKLAITMLCLLGFVMGKGYLSPVAAFLIALSVSSLAQVFYGTKFSSVILACGAACCAVLPEMVCMLPLLLYDALWEKKWWLMLGGVLCVISTPDIRIVFCSAALCVMTVIFYLRVSKLEETVGKLRTLRDEIAEKNVQLNMRNDAMTLAQDSEIHIATLKERNRIAREIHDNVGHLLTRSLLQAGALTIINKDETLKEPLASLKETLDTAMTGIRQSVHDLHDESIDLRRSIEESIAAVDGRFSVRLDYDMSENTDGKVKLCLLGVIKEGLSNAVKHSSGDSIFVSLQEHPAFYRLIIEDNGSCGQIKQTGIGLENMRERASSVGGNISFTPSENGFRIFLSIPK